MNAVFYTKISIHYFFIQNGLLLKDENPFRYASYFYDTESNLYYLLARFYDAKTGRFISEDAAPSDNLYIYTDDNPIGLTDSDGNMPAFIIGGYFLAVDTIEVPPVSEAIGLGATIAAGTYYTYKGASYLWGQASHVFSSKPKSKTNNSPEQLKRGQKFEKDVLKENKLKKNTKKLKNSHSIPNSTSKKRISEIKDQKYIYNSKQFRDYFKFGNGRPIDLYVGPNSKVSKPLQDIISGTNGNIWRRLGPNIYRKY